MGCSTCRYYFLAEQQCRRNAPAPIGHRQVAQWPKVRTTDWCGQYAKASANQEMPPLGCAAGAMAAE